MLSRPEGNKLRGSLPVHENERCVFFLKNKTSWLKKSPKERVVQLWHLVCIGGGVIVCLAAVLMWSGYFTAKHKYQTEATLTDIKVTSHKRLKSKEERSRDPFHQYGTYYKYTLTWQFMDPDTEKKYTFVRDDEANNPHAHKYGEKITLFIYYNDNPDLKGYDVDMSGKLELRSADNKPLDGSDILVFLEGWNHYDYFKLTDDDMMKIRNMGRKSLDEVRAKLKELGLSFKASDD